MNKLKILITCPPMINQINRYQYLFDIYNMEIYCPPLVQTLSEEQLISILPEYDGWIIGDDPATEEVFKASKLKAAVKWGVGVDNIDFDACKKMGISIDNTPAVFGSEVADLAVGYLIALSRQLFMIHSSVLNGNWYKPIGESLTNKKVCLIGFGDIGTKVATRLAVFDMQIYVSDPSYTVIYDGSIKNKKTGKLFFNLNVVLEELTICLTDADYIVITCSLNNNTYHLLNKDNITLAKSNVKIINVSRGAIINENDLIELQKNNLIDSVALDVFENEPLEPNNLLCKNPKNIFGSHNGSNTIEAVDRASIMAIEKLFYMIKQ